MKVGDVVQLKSGGPVMTVARNPEKMTIREYGNDMVLCWCV